ncbi:hypothetical protein GCM10027422_28800 [Hymenobacter arcticus]
MLIVYVPHGSTTASPWPAIGMLFTGAFILIYYALFYRKARRVAAKEEARIARIKAARQPGRRR